MSLMHCLKMKKKRSLFFFSSAKRENIVQLMRKKIFTTKLHNTRHMDGTHVSGTNHNSQLITLNPHILVRIAGNDRNFIQIGL
jgi:hypothetical protein